MTTRMTLSAILAVLAVAACTSLGEIDPAAPPSAGDAYYVIGVAPEFTKVAIPDGHVENGRFVASDAADLYNANTRFGFPVDGYILGKATGEPFAAITSVQLHSSATQLLSIPHMPCQEGLKTVVFQAQAGKVLYIANLRYLEISGTLVTAATNDIDGARAFLKAHYPRLASQLEQGTYQRLFCKD